MGDLATLLGGVGSLLAGITSSIALWIAWLRSSKRERRDAAEIATERTQQVAQEQAMDELLEAIADGHISAEEIAKIRKHLHNGDGKEADGA